MRMAIAVPYEEILRDYGNEYERLYKELRRNEKMLLRAPIPLSRKLTILMMCMIENGCSVICVNLVDRTAPTGIIDLARKNNVPVIFFNRELVEEDLMQWDKLYYVGADAYQSGHWQ